MKTLYFDGLFEGALNLLALMVQIYSAFLQRRKQLNVNSIIAKRKKNCETLSNTAFQQIVRMKSNRKFTYLYLCSDTVGQDGAGWLASMWFSWL